MDDPWFGALGLLLVAGLIFDAWFGNEMRRRVWLQVGLVLLALVVVLAIPKCSNSGHDGPDIEAPPYPY